LTGSAVLEMANFVILTSMTSKTLKFFKFKLDIHDYVPGVNRQ